MSAIIGETSDGDICEFFLFNLDNCNLILSYKSWLWKDDQSRSQVTLSLELLSGVASISNGNFQCKFHLVGKCL